MASVLASAARTTGSGNSTTQTIGDLSAEPRMRNLNIFLNVTASSAPTTLDVKVQWSMDGTNWFASPDAMTQVGAVGTSTEVKQFAIKGPYYRVTWTVAGTSYTFAVDAVVGV